MTRRWWSVVLIVALLMGLAACGGDDGDSSSADGGAKAASAEDAAGSAALATAAQAGVDRDIVYTADALVRVDDVEAASVEATAIAEDAGGFLSGQQAELEGDQESSLTIRVPAEKFRPVLDEVTALGTVRQRTISSDDVTAQAVDLRGRLESQQASADRLRALIVDAPDTTAIVAIEAELANREAEVESLQGQLRVLEDQATLATITVRFTEKAEGPKVDKDLPGFVQAVKRGGVALVSVLLVILAVVGFALPFVPFAVGGWFLVRWIRRRWPKKPSPPSAQWTAPGPAYPGAAPGRPRTGPPRPPAGAPRPGAPDIEHPTAPRPGPSGERVADDADETEPGPGSVPT